MTTLFFVLGLISLAALVSLLIDPKKFKSNTNLEPTRKDVLAGVLPFIIVFFGLAVWVRGCDDKPSVGGSNKAAKSLEHNSKINRESSPISENKTSSRSGDPNKHQNSNETHLPKFETIGVFHNVRSDKGPYFLIVIDPVDLSSSAFKNQIKEIASYFIDRHGMQINVDVFDDMKTAKLFASSDEIKYDNGKKLSKYEYNVLVGRHNIAMGYGTAGDPLFNLDFFPSGDNAEVAQYRSSVRF